MNKKLLLLLTALLIFAVSCSSGLYHRGKSELDAGNYQGAIASFKQATAENPDKAEYWQYLGQAYYKSGMYEDAVGALKQAVVLAPNNADSRLYLGLSYERMGSEKEAVSVYRAYLDKNPRDKFSDRIRQRVKFLTDKAVKAEVEQVIAQEKSIKTEAIPDNTLAVIGFNPGNLTPRYAPLARGLSELLTVDLSRIPELKVVERVKLQAIMDELELTRSEYFDKNRVPRVGKLLGASRVVSGQLSQDDPDKLKMESGIIEVKEGFVEYPENVEGDLNKFFDLQKTLARNVIVSLGYKLSPEQEAQLMERPTESFLGFLSYSLGLEYADQGMYSLAEAQFENAIREDPNFELAREARNQVSGLSSYTGEIEPASALEQDMGDYAASNGTGQNGDGLRSLQETLGLIPETGTDEGDNPYTEPVVGTGRVTVNGSFDE